MAYFLLFLRRMPDTNNAMSAARDAASTIESKTIGELSPVTAATRTFEFEPEAPLFVLLVIVLPVTFSCTVCTSASPLAIHLPSL